MNDSKDSRQGRDNQSLLSSSETKQGLVPIEQSPPLHVIRHRTDHQPSLQLGSDLRVFVYGQDSAFGRGAAQIRRTVLLLLVTATLCGIVYKFPSIHVALFNVEKNIELTTDLSQLERIRAKYRERPGFSNWAPLLYIQEVRIRSRTTLSHVAVTQSLNQKNIEQLTGAISRLSYVEATDKVQNVIGEVVSGLDSLSRRELLELQKINLEPIFGLWRTVYSASQNAFRETPALQSVNDSLAQARRRMVLAAMTSPRAGTTTLDLLQELDPDLLKGDRLLLDLAGNAVGGQVLRFLDACIRNYNTPDPEVRTAMRNVTIFPGQNNDEPITLDRLLLDTRPRLVNPQKISSIHGAVTPSRLATFRDALTDLSASEVLDILKDLEPDLEPYSNLLDHAYRRFVLVVTDPNTPKLYIPTAGRPSNTRSLYDWFDEGADQRLLKVASAEGRETPYREFAERFLVSIDPDREVTKFEDSLAQLMTAVYEPKPDLVRIGTLCDKLNSETFTSTEPGRTFVRLVQNVFIPIATWIQSGNTLPARDQGLLDDAYRELLLFFDSDVSLEESSTSKLSRKFRTKMSYQKNNQVFGSKLQGTLVTEKGLAKDPAKFRYNDDSLNETAEWDLKLLREERPGFVFFLELAFAVWLSEATYSGEPTYPFLEFPKRIINKLDPHKEGFAGTNAIGLKLLSQLSPPNLDTMEEFLTASKAVRREQSGLWPGLYGKDRYLFDNYAFAHSVVENTEFIKKYGMTPVWHRHILEALENFSQELKGRVLEGPNAVRDSIKNHAASKILSPEHEAYPLLKLTIAHSLLDSFVASGPGVFYPSNDRDPTHNLVDPYGDWRKLLSEQEFVKDDIHKANFKEYALKLGLRDKKDKDRFVQLKESLGGKTIEDRIKQTVYLWSYLATQYDDAESFFIPGWLMFKTDKKQHEEFVKDFERRAVR